MLAAVRKICLGLPETSERLSHGAPTFFIRDKRSFATVWNNHHGDGRYALICAAPDGMQAMLVEADPERFYVPPYVGHRGWIGVRLDRGFDRDEIAGILEDAYAEVAPPKLVEAARAPDLREEAGGRTRTDGRLITNQVLYQLSYSGAPPSVAAATAGLRGPSGARGSCA